MVNRARDTEEALAVIDAHVDMRRVALLRDKLGNLLELQIELAVRLEPQYLVGYDDMESFAPAEEDLDHIDRDAPVGAKIMDRHAHFPSNLVEALFRIKGTVEVQVRRSEHFAMIDIIVLVVVDTVVNVCVVVQVNEVQDVVNEGVVTSVVFLAMEIPIADAAELRDETVQSYCRHTILFFPWKLASAAFRFNSSKTSASFFSISKTLMMR